MKNYVNSSLPAKNAIQTVLESRAPCSLTYASPFLKGKGNRCKEKRHKKP